MEYANHLKEYASAMSEAQVAEEVDRIRKAAVRNHTPEVYKLCYSAVDLTTLSCTDSVESVTEFAGKAVKFYQQFPHLPNVASICIYPPFVETVGVVVDGTDMRITSVAGGFPSSQTFLEVKVLEVAMAVENGADEIDIVLNVGKMLEGHYDEVANEVEVIRTEMSPEVVLKVIIESGALKTPDLIRKASLLSMFAGADFVKTSTGKIDVSATPEAAVVMCQAIRDYYRKRDVRWASSRPAVSGVPKMPLCIIRSSRRFWARSGLRPNCSVSELRRRPIICLRLSKAGKSSFSDPNGRMN